MLIDTRRRIRRLFLLPLLASLLAGLLPSAALHAGPADPGNLAMQQLQWQQRQMWLMQGMLSDPAQLAQTMPAFLRIHSPSGKVEGMGLFTMVRGEQGMQPRLTYVELAGKRYLPGDTDSLLLWDLVGIPKGRIWAFIMAKGRISGFAFYPLEGVQAYTRLAPGSEGWLDEKNWRGPDSLERIFPSPGLFSTVDRVGEEAGGGDYAMALRLLNAEPSTPTGEEYLSLLKKAESLCKSGKAEEADVLFEKARERDADYPRLHYSRGRCLESRGDSTAALAAYRQAIRHAGLNQSFSQDVEERIRSLDPVRRKNRPNSLPSRLR